jgi:hypothetical protein
VWRSHNVELVALNRGLECSARLGLSGIVQFVTRECLTGSLLDKLRNSFVLRAEIVNNVVLIRNICDVGSLLNNLNILLRRETEFSVRGAREVAYADESVGRGADVVITVGPVMESNSRIEP